MEHIPVLKEAVQKCLDLERGNVVIDATLGLGGHALDILKIIEKEGILYAFEQDERNLVEAKKRLKPYNKQIVYFHDNFRYLKRRITGMCEASGSERSAQRGRAERGEHKKATASGSERSTPIDAVLFDLGLSSPHVDAAERGFSFQKDAVLDMRFDRRMKLTAADVLNTYSEKELGDIFYEYGEERMARRVARKVCEQREIRPFASTVEFAAFLEGVLPKKRSKKGRKAHPATKIFQALRIEVNDELNVLKEALEQAMELLKVGGRIVVISYHSLEDRIVKKFFRELEKPPVKSPEQAIYQTHDDPFVEIITKKPVVPLEKEIKENPRSRSAKLRACKKLR